MKAETATTANRLWLSEVDWVRNVNLRVEGKLTKS